VIYLGINQDRYESGVAVTDGRRVLYAAGEERFTRRKNQGGFPYRALAAAFRTTGLAPADVRRVCMAGVTTPPLPARLFPRLHGWLFAEDRTGRHAVRDRMVDYLVQHTPLAHAPSGSTIEAFTRALAAPAVQRTLGRPLGDLPLALVEHHHGHAAAAWCLSGFEEALCLTGDGMGDGVSMSVSRCSPAGIVRLWSASSRASLGVFYEMVTDALGFIPSRHEGKVTGLAASGDPARVALSSPFAWEGERLTYTGQRGRKGVAWLRESVVAHHSREDVAAWAQAILERHVLEVARTWLQRTGLTRLTVAGGIFANVKLNQRLHELDEVRAFFVCPNMGDGGLSLGAVCAQGGLREQAVDHVFWGDAFSDTDVEATLRARGCAFERCEAIDERAAELLAGGHLVARFQGAMEWGPRALGHRSVLAPTGDPALVGRLNRLLQRSEFMPFAPAVLAEDAGEWFTGLAPARHAAEFMTACFTATARMRAAHPAVVHVDGTVRPQLVRREANPSLHHLLQAYKRHTGSGLILNTSFNIHEEPIVGSAGDALRAFATANLDVLALGDQLVWRPDAEPPPA
jgi:carbamoyltransferase